MNESDTIKRLQRQRHDMVARIRELELENIELKKESTANSWERASRLGYLK